MSTNMETGNEQQPNFVLQHGLTTLSSPFFIAQLVLRALTVLSTIAAIFVMVTSGDSINLIWINFSAKYNYSSAFRFLLGADVVVCVLVLLSLVGVYFLQQNKFNPNHWFLMFLHDLIVMVLLISACGAATAVGYIGLKGLNATSWFEICDRVEKFCRRTGVSIGLSYVAFLCLFALTIMSSYRLKAQIAPQ